MKNRVYSVILVIALGSMVGGCAAPLQPVQEVRSSLSPNRDGIPLSLGERLNRRAQTRDLNTRQIPDDWDSIWLNDRPLRMSLYPIP